MSATAAAKKMAVKCTTTELKNARVAAARPSVRKPTPSETATNRSATNVAPAVPTST